MNKMKDKTNKFFLMYLSFMWVALQMTELYSNFSYTRTKTSGVIDVYLFFQIFDVTNPFTLL